MSPGDASQYDLVCDPDSKILFGFDNVRLDDINRPGVYYPEIGLSPRMSIKPGIRRLHGLRQVLLRPSEWCGLNQGFYHNIVTELYKIIYLAFIFKWRRMPSASNTRPPFSPSNAILFTILSTVLNLELE